MFKYTIRDLLWLTLVVAVGLGWFVREQRFLATLVSEGQLKSRLEALEKHLNQIGAGAKWEETPSGWKVHTKTPY